MNEEEIEELNKQIDSDLNFFFEEKDIKKIGDFNVSKIRTKNDQIYFLSSENDLYYVDEEQKVYKLKCPI